MNPFLAQPRVSGSGAELLSLDLPSLGWCHQPHRLGEKPGTFWMRVVWLQPSVGDWWGAKGEATGHGKHH